MVHIPQFDLETHPTGSLYLGMAVFTALAALFLTHMLVAGLKIGTPRPPAVDPPEPPWVGTAPAEVQEARMTLRTIRRERAERDAEPDHLTAISSFLGALAFLWAGTRPCILEWQRRRRVQPG